MQLADLVARPIGLQVSIPQQPNRAFDLLARKFYCSGVVPKREAASRVGA